MAKPKTNLIIEEVETDPNLLRVWMPTLTPALIEAIEGVVSVYHARSGHLNVWLNPCYDKGEIVAEIKAISDA